MSNSYIAIDWGSTNLRAWLYLHDELAASTRSEEGVRDWVSAAPTKVFREVVAPWAQHNVPVIMAGMVGSNAGWVAGAVSVLPHQSDRYCR